MRLFALFLLPAALLAQVQPPKTPPPADLSAPPADAVTSASGLVAKVLKPGRGTERPAANGVVVAHFAGWRADGACFADTRRQDVPAYLLMEKLLPGMREGLGAMVAGEARRLWIPEALASRGDGQAKAGPLVMDVELLDVQTHPLTAPDDVAGPPSDAQVLPSGLAFKVLKPGTGTVRPGHLSHVQVHYSGWTTDGKLFESSLLKRETAVFKLSEVIPGWDEGLQLMVAGERRRFWIPQRLAYRGERGKPAGMLVFDIELLTVAK